MAITNRDLFGHTGVPHRYSDTIEAELEAIFTGDVPARSGIDFPVARGQNILALTVVGLNRSGHVVPAEFSPVSRIAQGEVTLDGNPANNASVTIAGGLVYEVKDNPASDLHAQRGGDQAATVNALIKVINDDPDGFAYAFLESANLIRLTARSPGAHGNASVAISGAGFQAEQDLAGGTGGVVPIGVMAYTIETGFGLVSQGVYVSGVFNPDRLIWDDSFSNDSLKKIAFAHAPAYSRCLLRKIRANTV